MIDFKNIRKNTFQIGQFRIEPTRNLIKKDAQNFSLEPKIMDVLCELASYPGEVIGRYDLIQRVWKVDYGADESLTRAISVLRKTFRTGGAAEKYIETISKNGYRLIAPVSAWEEDGTRQIPQPAKRAFIAPPAKTPTTSPPQPITPAPIKHASIVTPTPSLPVNTAPSPIPASKPTSRSKPTSSLKGLIPVVAILVLLAVATPFAVGYFNAHSDAYETEIAELRDLSTVDPGALDKIDPIIVDEPFRGDVSDTVSSYGRSVAVIPFVDMSADGTKRYFADGMAEDVLLELASIEGLRIVSRNASASAMNEGANLSTIGDILRVSHLIDGSVRTMGERVRVSVQLVESNTQTQLWGNSYDGSLKDGLNLQSEIARDIADELNLLLALNDDTPIEFNLSTFGASPSDALDSLTNANAKKKLRIPDFVPN